MILFTRRTRLTGGNGTAGTDWAVNITAQVKKVTGQDVQLWATVFSPGVGTITWTAWLDDLAALETLTDKLAAEPALTTLANEGAKFTDGTLDDVVYQPVYGQPDPARDIQYVAGVVGVIAAGSYVRALAVGTEIAEKAEKVTGIPTTFASAVTGSYGGVGFLTGYATIAAFEAAQTALASDASWLKLVDSSKGCFVEDAAITQQTLFRRVV
jgi:hypothetical protein